MNKNISSQDDFSNLLYLMTFIICKQDRQIRSLLQYIYLLNNIRFFCSLGNLIIKVKLEPYRSP